MQKKEKNNQKKGYFLKIFKLFYSSFYVNAVAFGGGFVILPILKEIFVKKFRWVEEEELYDIHAVAQSSPGTIAGNTALLIGYKTAGVFGAAASVSGGILPPLIIITALYYFYDYFIEFELMRYVLGGMQAGVAAVIFDLVLEIFKKTVKKGDIFAVIILFLSFIASFTASFFFNFSLVIYAVILSGITGIAVSYLGYFKGKKG